MLNIGELMMSLSVDLSDAFSGIDSFKSTVSGAMDDIQTALQSTSDSLSTVGDAATTSLDGASASIAEATSTLSDMSSTAIDSGGTIAGALDEVAAAADSTGAALVDAGSSISGIGASASDVSGNLGAMSDDLNSANADLQSLGDTSSGITGQIDKFSTASGQSLQNVGAIAELTRVKVGALGLGIGALFVGAVEPTTHYIEIIQRLSLVMGATPEMASRLVAGFESSGMSADQAAGMVQRLSMRLGAIEQAKNKASAAGKAYSSVLDQIGVSAFDAAGKMLPMQDLMPKILESLKNMTDPAMRSRIAMQLFGRSWTDLAPLIAKGGQAFTDAMAQADQFGNVINQKDIDAIHKLKEEQSGLSSSLRGIEIQLGLLIIPLLIKLIDWVTGLIQKWHDLSPALQDTIVHFIGIGGAMAGLLGGGSALVRVFGAFSSLLPVLAGPLEGLSGAVSAFLGPIALVVGVFLALKYAYDNWAWAHRALQPLVDAMQLGLGFLAKAASAVSDAFHAGLDTFSKTRDIWQGIASALDDILKKIGASPQDIANVNNSVSTLGTSFTALKNAAGDALGGIGKFFSDNKEKFKTIAQDTLHEIGQLISDRLSMIADVFQAMKDLIHGDFRAFGQDIAQYARDAGSNIIDRFLLPFRAFGSVLGPLKDKAIEGFKEFFKELFSDPGKFVGNAANVFKTILGFIFNFDKSVLTGLTDRIRQPIADALGKAIDAIVSTFKNLWDVASTKIAGIAESWASVLKTFFINLPNRIQEFIGDLPQHLADAMIAVFEFIAIQIVAKGLGLLFDAVAFVLKAVLDEFLHLPNQIIQAIPQILSFFLQIAAKIWEWAPKLAAIVLIIGAKIIEKFIEIFALIAVKIIEWVAPIVVKWVEALLQFPIKTAEALGHVLQAFFDLGVNILAWVTGEFVHTLDTLFHEVAALPTNVLHAIGDTLSVLVSKGKDLIIGLVTGMGAQAVSLYTWMGELPGKIISSLFGVGKSALDLLFNVGKDIVEGLVMGVINAPRKIWDVLTGIVSDAWHAVLRFLHIESPSKLFYDIGGNIIMGIVNGIVDNADAIGKALLDVGKSVLEKGASFVGGILKGAGSLLSPVVMGGLHLFDQQSPGIAGSARTTSNVINSSPTFNISGTPQQVVDQINSALQQHTQDLVLTLRTS